MHFCSIRKLLTKNICLPHENFSSVAISRKSFVQSKAKLYIRLYKTTPPAMTNHNYCILLAGGVGKRLWPVSRERKPKQFIDFFGIGKTLLQLTFERFATFLLSKTSIFPPSPNTLTPFANNFLNFPPKTFSPNPRSFPPHRLPHGLLGASPVATPRPASSPHRLTNSSPVNKPSHKKSPKDWTSFAPTRVS